jgi:AcrR family transcriptional regulator
VPKLGREANLSTRGARARLDVAGKPYFRALTMGLHLGYRKSRAGAAWVVRWYLGGGKYCTATLDGRPDDVLEADNIRILDWIQAQKRARLFLQKWPPANGRSRLSEASQTSTHDWAAMRRESGSGRRPVNAPAAIPGVPNGPKQKRSRASVLRMLKAAAELMKETDGRSPTIAEVSRRGKVSISSIYSRFDSKEALVGAALSRVVEEIDAEQREMLAKALRGAHSLPLFIPRLVDGMSEFIRDNRSILRVLTQRATGDAESHNLAVISYNRSLAQVSEALLRYRQEITCPDPEQTVRAIFRIVYATAAGFLGFAQGFDKAGIETWLQLKRDLETMCILLLTAPILTKQTTELLGGQTNASAFANRRSVK